MYYIIYEKEHIKNQFHWTNIFSTNTEEISQFHWTDTSTHLKLKLTISNFFSQKQTSANWEI